MKLLRGLISRTMLICSESTGKLALIEQAFENTNCLFTLVKVKYRCHRSSSISTQSRRIVVKKTTTILQTLHSVCTNTSRCDQRRKFVTYFTFFTILWHNLQCIYSLISWIHPPQSNRLTPCFNIWLTRTHANIFDFVLAINIVVISNCHVQLRRVVW